MQYIVMVRIYHPNIIRYNLDILLYSAMVLVVQYLKSLLEITVHHTQELAGVLITGAHGDN